MKAIFELINPDNTLSVNRRLAHALGLQEAVLFHRGGPGGIHGADPLSAAALYRQPYLRRTYMLQCDGNAGKEVLPDS